ncbi:MAG: hypothetical protein IJT87_07555 [Ruminiclostridium sp.]|nr:hypothetical protein [Ruminiclostridium sp.]
MKKHISLFAAAAIALGMIQGLSVPAAAAEDIPVSISSAVKTSYSVKAAVIGNNAELNGYDAAGSDLSDFVRKVNAAALGKIILPAAEASSSEIVYTISGRSDSGFFYVSLIRGKYYDCFRINGNYYPVNGALDKACRKIVEAGAAESSVPDRMLKYRVKCGEPKTEEEYYNAAATLVGAWLDTLKKETGEYKLGSYSFNGKTLPTERDILRGEGIISGGREFCCTVGFDVKGISKESVFAEPKNSGYNKFYNYYSGALVVVRCRWENGVCRIVDYGSGGGLLTRGLNGIRTNNTQYDTLFDFYRDTKTVEKLNKACTYDTRSRQPNAATSPIFMANGRVGYVAIYPRYTASADKSGIKTTVYDNYFFDENYNGTYSSPIDFKDGDGAQKENYHESFDLVFDDYNRDGCADYAIKQSASDETADGAMYEVRCMSNDMTPRSDRFSFFMAGRHEESIRLQHSDLDGYIYWSKGADGKLYTDTKIDDYRMYSERFYLPAEQRIYDDEESIYCFFWNNTEKDVKVGGKYSIEYCKNGEWVSVTGDKTLSARTAKAYYDTELKFDISDIKQRTAGEYRVVMKVGGKTVYGGFYIGSRNASISVTADEKTVPAGSGTVALTVKNTGTEPVRLTKAYIAKDGRKVADVTVDDGLLLSGGEKNITAELDRTLAEGKYTMKVSYGKKTASCRFTIKKISDDKLTFFGGKCTVKSSGEKLTVTVKNNKYTKETAYLGYGSISSPEALVNGKWTSSGLMLSSDIEDAENKRSLDIAYGKTVSFMFSDPYDMIMSDPEALAQAKDYYKYIMDELEKEKDSMPAEAYKKYKDMTFEDVIRMLVSGAEETVKPPKNSLYRLRINSEYVYFRM